MTIFQGFTKATLLYAENWGIVTAMEKQFRMNLDEFFDAIRDRIREQLPALQEHAPASGWRYWWLSPDAKRRDDHPQLTFGGESDRLRVVNSGIVSMLAIAPKATEEQLHRLTAVADTPELAAICKALSGGTWSLFRVNAKCGGSDPVGVVAQQVVMVLKALEEATSVINEPHSLHS